MSKDMKYIKPFKKMVMKKNNKSGIDRRKFFKVFGTGAAVSAAAFYGCKNNAESSVAGGEGEIPTDK